MILIIKKIELVMISVQILFLMDNSQIINIFAITSVSNILVNFMLQNNLIYSIFILILVSGSFVLGIVSENKLNLVRKLRNFNIKKINETLNEPLAAANHTNVNSDSDSEDDN